MHPGVFLPTVLRAWRLFFMYRVSTKKQAVAAQHLEWRNNMRVDSATEVDDQKQVEMVETVPDCELEMGNGNGSNNDGDSDSGGIDEEEDTDVPEGKEEKQNAIAKRRKREIENPATKERTSMRKEKLLKAMTISESSPFLIAVFVMAVLFHLLVWLGTSFIDPAIYFDFTQGCYFGRVQMTLGIVLALFYVVMMFILGVLLLTVKDTWFMR